VLNERSGRESTDHFSGSQRCYIQILNLQLLLESVQ